MLLFITTHVHTRHSSTKHRTSESEFFRLNIGTSDIGHVTRIGRTLIIACSHLPDCTVVRLAFSETTCNCLGRKMVIV